MGNEYEKIIEIFNHQVNLNIPWMHPPLTLTAQIFTSRSTKKMSSGGRGPSKENRHDPIIGLGLLLDANQIPIGMKLYPGNESEKPVIRQVIKRTQGKEPDSLAGRCRSPTRALTAQTISSSALKNKDGYLFSKSVKQLPETKRRGSF